MLTANCKASSMTSRRRLTENREADPSELCVLLKLTMATILSTLTVKRF